MICDKYPECSHTNFGSGFDFDHPDGYHDDETECLEAHCDWQAAGAYAEHAALHHWIETGHRWRLLTRSYR